MFGDFGEVDHGKNFFTYSFFLVASLFIPLVMLNLLIAIISEAYAGIADNLDKQDYY
jgi:Na+-translocating ferredoxin:NAD+ oxidoreductase RnfE subunit